MTPQEAATLQKIGKDLRKSFAAIIVKTFLFPLYAVCFYHAINILRKKPRGWMMGINMAILILLFLMASSLISIDISNFITLINTTFVHNGGTVLDTKYGEASNTTFNRVLVIDAIYGYMTVLGDAIIVWRVTAFWNQGKRRWVIFGLYSMLLASVVIAMLLNYCVARLGTELFLGGFQDPPFCRNIQITSYAMPAATTFIATSLIGLTFWDYHRRIKPGLPPASHQSSVEKVLLLLVESGFLYFLFFLYTVLCNDPRIAKLIAKREDLTFVNFIVSFCASIIVGCYPTLIIILAHSERTLMDNNLTGVSTHLTFAGTGGTASRSNRMLETATDTRFEDEIELTATQSGQEPNEKAKRDEKVKRVILPL